jgi:MFS family permease
MLLVGAQTGRLERRFGSKPPLLAGALLTASAYVLLAFARSEHWHVYLASTLLGAGIGLAFASMANLIIENVGPAETGIATGMNTVTRTVGGAFGGSAVASILAASIHETTGYPSTGGFTTAFAACALALVAGVLVGLAIPQRRPENAFATHEAGDLPLPSPAGGRSR